MPVTKSDKSGEFVRRAASDPSFYQFRWDKSGEPGEKMVTTDKEMPEAVVTDKEMARMAAPTSPRRDAVG
jgi:hypothetical protein